MYTSNNRIFCMSQYGFRTEHSTELAALELVDKTITALDNDTPFSISFDFSKAFDTIDHQILLNKLSHYGIKKTALKLFENLTNQTEFVDFNGFLSNTNFYWCTSRFNPWPSSLFNLHQ